MKVQQILDLCLENRLFSEQQRLAAAGLNVSTECCENRQQVAPSPLRATRPTHLSLLKPILVVDRGQQQQQHDTMPLDCSPASSDSPSIAKKRVTLIDEQQQ